jgi:hypothetical protein
LALAVETESSVVVRAVARAQELAAAGRVPAQASSVAGSLQTNRVILRWLLAAFDCQPVNEVRRLQLCVCKFDVLRQIDSDHLDGSKRVDEHEALVETPRRIERPLSCGRRRRQLVALAANSRSDAVAWLAPCFSEPGAGHNGTSGARRREGDPCASSLVM